MSISRITVVDNLYMHKVPEPFMNSQQTIGCFLMNSRHRRNSCAAADIVEPMLRVFQCCLQLGHYREDLDIKAFIDGSGNLFVTAFINQLAFIQHPRPLGNSSSHDSACFSGAWYARDKICFVPIQIVSISDGHAILRRRKDCRRIVDDIIVPTPRLPGLSVVLENLFHQIRRDITAIAGIRHCPILGKQLFGITLRGMDSRSLHLRAIGFIRLDRADRFEFALHLCL